GESLVEITCCEGLVHIEKLQLLLQHLPKVEDRQHLLSQVALLSPLSYRVVGCPEEGGEGYAGHLVGVLGGEEDPFPGSHVGAELDDALVVEDDVFICG